MAKRKQKSNSNHRSHNHNNVTSSAEKYHKHQIHQETKNDNMYLVKQSEVLGRYLVAAKPIPAGEVIMIDEPIVIGPCQESKPLCIGCYNNINLKYLSSFHRCQKCGWPLCSPTCDGYYKSQGHSKEECEILANSTIKDKPIEAFTEFYYALTPFRSLVIKCKDPEKWSLIETMESHTNERKKCQKLWETNQKMAVEIIRNKWGLKDYSEEEIHFVCGILEVNAFEISPRVPENQCLRGIYPNAFLFAHDCVPNTNHSNGEDFKLIVRSTTLIPVDNNITVSYTYTLQSTLKRRKHLKETKFFLCSCKRCIDPTELNTYLGALKCPVCKGILLPKSPLDEDSSWQCNSPKCKHEMNVSQIIPILEKYFNELDSINGNNIIMYEEFLKKCKTMFHENHYLILSAMHCLSQLYGKIKGYLINDLTEEQLERKIEICKKLIKTFEKLEPGLSKQRGILLYELHAPLMVLIQRRFERQGILKKEMKVKLKEVLKYLEEAHLILSKEPKSSTEEVMARAAESAIATLKNQTCF